MGVQIDATPFKQWYECHYGQPLGRKKGHKAGEMEDDPLTKPRSHHLQRRSMLENQVLSWINIWKISLRVVVCWLVFRRDLVKVEDVMGTSLRGKSSTFI